MAGYELGVIGAGNMAEAVIRGAIGGGFLRADSIIASEPLASRRETLERELGIACVENNAAAACCPHVLLAVKPQVVQQALEATAETIRPDAVVISIAAGIATKLLDRWLQGRGKIIRVMPNTPMLAGAGMSAISPGPRTGESELRWTEKLFAASGKTIFVDERHMDAVTAVSGSGPAYFFYVIEAMIEAAVAEGMDAETAIGLAVQTCAGAAKLLSESGETPKTLRKKVTSPGGTTQRAIETMESAGVMDAIIQAVRAAAARSRELGR